MDIYIHIETTQHNNNNRIASIGTGADGDGSNGTEQLYA